MHKYARAVERIRAVVIIACYIREAVISFLSLDTFLSVNVLTL